MVVCRIFEASDFNPIGFNGYSNRRTIEERIDRLRKSFIIFRLSIKKPIRSHGKPIRSHGKPIRSHGKPIRSHGFFHRGQDPGGPVHFFPRLLGSLWPAKSALIRFQKSIYRDVPGSQGEYSSPSPSLSSPVRSHTSRT